MIGHIHSLESFGTHEGPGIRYVVFMQGCRARCRYCHNPDTWRLEEGKRLTAQAVFDKILNCVPYFQASGGGVTASGGEPLLQPEFLTELFTLCRAEQIHTAIDTSGFGAFSTKLSGINDRCASPGGTSACSPAFQCGVTSRVESKVPEGRSRQFLTEGVEPPPDPSESPIDSLSDLIALTDLFLIDIKWADPQQHKTLTGRSLDEPLALIARLEELGRPYWIRHVLAPGLNDGEGDLLALKSLLAPLRHCARFELLPYHTLGVHKWEELGLDYSLKDTRFATESDVKRAMKILDR